MASFGSRRRSHAEQPMSDEEYALRLQLEMNGAGALSGGALAGLGLWAPPRDAADFRVAALMRLLDAGAGRMDASTVASISASDDDAAMAKVLVDDEGLALADFIVAESLAQAEVIPNAPTGNILKSVEKNWDRSVATCPVCLEMCAAVTMKRLGSCKHSTCASCARTYLSSTCKDRRTFPVPCPGSPSCREPLDPQLCLGAMAGTDAYDVLDSLFVEKLHVGRIRYCINKRCGAAFDVRATRCSRVL
jgi:hypothetical protein